MDAGTLFNGAVAVCAVAALVLSVHQEVQRRQERKSQIKVRMDTGFVIGGPVRLVFTAVNEGIRPVTLGGDAMIELPDGDSKIFLAVEMPGRPRWGSNVRFPTSSVKAIPANRG